MSGPVKPVFASPTGLMPEHTVNMAGSCSLIDNLVTRHSFPDDVSKAQASVQKEEHAKRLRSLRKELEYIEKTNWQYEPIEKILGQS